jgi:hypothetical protein
MDVVSRTASTFTGRCLDTVFVEAYEAGAAGGILIAQSYRSVGLVKKRTEVVGQGGVIERGRPHSFDHESTPELRNFGTPELRNSGTPALRHFDARPSLPSGVMRESARSSSRASGIVRCSAEQPART